MAGASPAQQTLDAAEGRVRSGMAVSAASSRLQPCRPASFAARFPRFLTADNTPPTLFGYDKNLDQFGAGFAGLG